MRPSLESDLHNLRKSKCRSLRPSTQLVSASHKHVHAMGAQHTHEEGSEQTHSPPCISKCIRHCQYTSSDVSFQQMHHGVKVRSGVFEIAIQKRIAILQFASCNIFHIDQWTVDGSRCHRSVRVALVVAVQQRNFFITHSALLAFLRLQILEKQTICNFSHTKRKQLTITKIKLILLMHHRNSLLFWLHLHHQLLYQEQTKTPLLNYM